MSHWIYLKICKKKDFEIRWHGPTDGRTDGPTDRHSVLWSRELPTKKKNKRSGYWKFAINEMYNGNGTIEVGLKFTVMSYATPTRAISCITQFFSAFTTCRFQSASPKTRGKREKRGKGDSLERSYRRKFLVASHCCIKGCVRESIRWVRPSVLRSVMLLLGGQRLISCIRTCYSDVI